VCPLAKLIATSQTEHGNISKPMMNCRRKYVETKPGYEYDKIKTLKMSVFNTTLYENGCVGSDTN
jgi:hypothetical protein